MNGDLSGREELLCGLDEAGRGPLAGPVCAAAVILPRDFPVEILRDSKKLSSAAREKARTVICSRSVAWGIGWASETEIDDINILNASLLAMKRAFEEMFAAFEKTHDACNGSGTIRAIADGLFAPDISVPEGNLNPSNQRFGGSRRKVPCEPLVKADATVPEVMAASILAKTARDRLMEIYGIFYPQYGYGQHKGYPTKAHREAILRFGPSPIQRMSFRVG